MKTTNKIPQHFEPSQTVNMKEDVHVELFSKSGTPVAAVLWRGTDPQPFMVLKDNGTGGVVRGSLVFSDDIPAYDKRDTYLSAKIEVLLKDGDFIAGLSITEKGANAPSLTLVGDDEDAYGTPTIEQLQALARFKASHEAKGRKDGEPWEERLGSCWLRAAYPGVVPEDAALLQQVRNRLGPEWLMESAAQAIASMDKLPSADLAVLLTFNVHNVKPLLPEIQAAASHIPKYWEVSDAERQQIARLFAQPVVQDGQVRFQGTFHGAQADLDRYAELAQEMAKKLHDKKFVIPGSALDNVRCLFASGGLKDAVVSPSTLQIASGNKYVISINRERWDAPALAAGTPSATSVELERVPVSEAAFKAAAQHYAINAIASRDIETEYVWFKSSAFAGGDGVQSRHSLHVHEVDGREPDTQAYKDIAQKLGIDVQLERDAVLGMEA